MDCAIIVMKDSVNPTGALELGWPFGYSELRQELPL